MKKLVWITFGLIISQHGFCQYPFEKFPTPAYKEYKNWQEYDLRESKGRLHYTLSIPSFFDAKDSLTIQLSQYNTEKATAGSIVRIFRNKQMIQKLDEPMILWYTYTESVRIADLNNDKLPDVKLCLPYGGNGLAGYNYRVVYLIQKEDGTFTKLSYLDKMASPRSEYDLDNDGNFEVITMELNSVDEHNYWTFNVYNFENETLVNQNEKFGYPLLFQYLFKPNFKLANLPDSVVKSFSQPLPLDFYKN